MNATLSQCRCAETSRLMHSKGLIVGHLSPPDCSCDCDGEDGLIRRSFAHLAEVQGSGGDAGMGETVYGMTNDLHQLPREAKRSS